MREIIELRNVCVGPNLSGTDTATPWAATAVLDCGHKKNVGGGHPPAYHNAAAIAAVEDLLGKETTCPRCAKTRIDHMREVAAMCGSLGVLPALTRMRDGLETARWRLEGTKRSQNELDRFICQSQASESERLVAFPDGS